MQTYQSLIEEYEGLRVIIQYLREDLQSCESQVMDFYYDDMYDEAETLRAMAADVEDQISYYILRIAKVRTRIEAFDKAHKLTTYVKPQKLFNEHAGVQLHY